MQFNLLGLRPFAIAIAISTVVSAFSAPAFADFQKTEDAIKYRQSSLSLMGTHFSRIGAVVKGEASFNKEDVAKNAAIVNMLSSLPWQGFGPGTESPKALASIWSEAPKFKLASDKLQTATAELNTAAQSGNLDNIKKAFGAVGQACKGCHDYFRKK